MNVTKRYQELYQGDRSNLLNEIDFTRNA